MATNERTLEQRRAAHALEAIRSLEMSGKYGNYVSYVKGLPATILQNGLGQAMATLLAGAKGNEQDAHRRLYDHLQCWLCRSEPEAPYSRDQDLLAAITGHDEAHYLRAQAEALAYLTWLKKLAVAYLRAPDKREGADREEA